MKCPYLQISEDDQSITMIVQESNDKFVFPKDDCVKLPLEFTSMEALSKHIREVFLEKL